MNSGFVLVDLGVAGQVRQRREASFSLATITSWIVSADELRTSKVTSPALTVSVLTAIPIVTFDISLPVAGYPRSVAISHV